MEKKIVNTPLLLPKASAINEKSKNSPSSKNLKMEENIQLKPLQPVLKKRYGFIFAKILFKLFRLLQMPCPSIASNRFWTCPKQLAYEICPLSH